jgi:hypothetical protein
VLFRGGLREVEVVLAEFDTVGLGVEDIFICPSSCDISDMASFLSGVKWRDAVSSIVSAWGFDVDFVVRVIELV